ncbi:hypothetical protein [Nostocoides australiense]|nr:hypothetical protein [Tetrasphaera australiensis]
MRDHRLGIGSRLLSLTIPAGLLTLAVALLADGWASPVLLTMSVLGGLAVVGAGAPPPVPTPERGAQIARPTRVDQPDPMQSGRAGAAGGSSGATSAVAEVYLNGLRPVFAAL